MPDTPDQSILERLVRRICDRCPGVRAIYHFGSTATGQENRQSDLDLAVFGLSGDPLGRFDLAGELARIAGRDVDLVPLESASTVMRAQILAHGTRLYCADPAHCDEFEARALSDYARLNFERRGILADIRARGSIHG